MDIGKRDRDNRDSYTETVGDFGAENRDLANENRDFMEWIWGSNSCIKKERNALFELKKYIISLSEDGESNDHLTTWANDTKSDCCMWKGLKCDATSGRVIQLSISLLSSKSRLSAFSSLFDDVEGYRSLRKLRNLKTLNLSSNYFNNSIFPFLSAATSLTTLSLRYNDMDGSFPVKELRDLMNLEVLNLSGNRFNGSIPIQEFSYMRKLKALSLSGNEVSGSIELQGVCKLKHIEELDLSSNKLVGQFPLCITSLTGLRVLDLSSNNLIASSHLFLEVKISVECYFTGKLQFGEDVIPKSFSGLKNVESLDLSFNRLQGRIPPQLTDLSSLVVFNVSFNNLSGVIPEGRQFNTFDTQSYLGNPFLCGQANKISCNGNIFQEPDNGVEADESTTIDMESFYWSFAAAYVTILLGLLASLSFDSPWSRVWFYNVDVFVHKVRKLL
ncbi:PREDICTED: LRR receptor-like serine/threonine-protein kinase ERL2 [Camelina sativa]|uniref:LRR receptor-like serine/threonine-protein kinase ERL2 n=1 Tax=Camelina sativa TaxID=90675 RepID=A0ABM0T104_CAMSA|nr:PREDICTED: LRR receptor-like serine/threonine-protein kinase ERL2 [Camelina sativa]